MDQAKTQSNLALKNMALLTLALPREVSNLQHIFMYRVLHEEWRACMTNARRSLQRRASTNQPGELTSDVYTFLNKIHAQNKNENVKNKRFLLRSKSTTMHSMPPPPPPYALVFPLLLKIRNDIVIHKLPTCLNA